MRLGKARWWADPLSLSLSLCVCVCLRRETWEASHNISAAKHRSPLSMLWRPAVVINNGNCAKLNPAREPHARPGAIPQLAPEDASPRRAVASRARDLRSSSNASFFFFPLTLAMNPSDPFNRRGKSCIIAGYEDRSRKVTNFGSE